MPDPKPPSEKRVVPGALGQWPDLFQSMCQVIVATALAEQRKRIAVRICPNCGNGDAPDRVERAWYHIGIRCYASAVWEEGESDGDR